MTFFKAMIKFHERRAKTLALTQLRSLTERQLVDCNISPELLAKGLKGWPWRNHPEVSNDLLQSALVFHRDDINAVRESSFGIPEDKSVTVDTVATRKTVSPSMTDKAA